MEWKNLIPLFRNKPWTYRLKIKEQPLTQEWSTWLMAPTETYLETERQGPYPISKIEWIEINPIEIKKHGRLMPIKETNHSEELIKLLKDCSLLYIRTDRIFQILI